MKKKNIIIQLSRTGLLFLMFIGVLYILGKNTFLCYILSVLLATVIFCAIEIVAKEGE